jgi:hypothetical protein
MRTVRLEKAMGGVGRAFTGREIRRMAEAEKNLEESEATSQSGLLKRKTVQRAQPARKSRAMNVETCLRAFYLLL